MILGELLTRANNGSREEEVGAHIFIENLRAGRGEPPLKMPFSGTLTIRKRVIRPPPISTGCFKLGTNTNLVPVV